eukprot:748321-Hanusia_phi.AAC.4
MRIQTITRRWCCRLRSPARVSSSLVGNLIQLLLLLTDFTLLMTSEQQSAIFSSNLKLRAAAQVLRVYQARSGRRKVEVKEQAGPPVKLLASHSFILMSCGLSDSSPFSSSHRSVSLPPPALLLPKLFSPLLPYLAALRLAASLARAHLGVMQVDDHDADVVPRASAVASHQRAATRAPHRLNAIHAKSAAPCPLLSHLSAMKSTAYTDA